MSWSKDLLHIDTPDWRQKLHGKWPMLCDFFPNGDSRHYWYYEWTSIITDMKNEKKQVGRNKELVSDRGRIPLKAGPLERGSSVLDFQGHWLRNESFRIQKLSYLFRNHRNSCMYSNTLTKSQKISHLSRHRFQSRRVLSLKVSPPSVFPERETIGWKLQRFHRFSRIVSTEEKID